METCHDLGLKHVLGFMWQRSRHHYGTFGKWWGPSLPSITVIKYCWKTDWGTKHLFDSQNHHQGKSHWRQNLEVGTEAEARVLLTSKLSSRILLLL